MKALLTDRPRSALQQGGIALMFLTFLPLTGCTITEADLKMTEKNLQQRIKQQDDQLSQTRAKQSQEIASLREQELPQLRGELESVMHQVQELQAKQEGLKQQMKLLEQIVGKIERTTGAKKSSGTIANDLTSAADPENAAAVNELPNRGPAIRMEGIFSDGYAKYVRRVSFVNSEIMNGKEITTEYSISVVGPTDNDYMVQNNDGTSMEAGGKLKLKVEGEIRGKRNEGTPEITVLSGILYGNNQNILSSWLYSTNCHKKPTDMTKILAALKTPVSTGANGQG